MNLCITSLLAASMILSGNGAQTVHATTSLENIQPPIVVTSSIEIQPRLDVQQWKYKRLNGATYKRLWSKTRGIWLTDWILL